MAYADNQLLNRVLCHSGAQPCSMHEGLTMSSSIPAAFPGTAVYEQLAAVNQRIEHATGLPNAAYTDPAWFAFERDHVLSRGWAALLFASDLPKPGYAKPITFMGLALLAVRDEQGQIRVFHNVCSHRGMVMVSEETEVAGRLRCPYHSWTYDLAGRLQSTPHIGGVGVHQAPGFECAAHRLQPARCAHWLGVVFINLSGDAPPLTDHIQPLAQHWQAYTGDNGLATLRVAPDASHLALTVRANWKLAVENHCEAYHLPWVHPGLNAYSPLDQHYGVIINEAMSGQGTHFYNLAETAGTQLPQFAQWPTDVLRHAEYIALYPNLLLGLQADHILAMIVQPQAPDHSLERLEITYIGDTALSDAFSGHRSAVLESWKTVFNEDVLAIEGMQRGRQSPAFHGGVFSPVLDTSNHNFHRWVAARYCDTQTPATAR